MGTTMTLVTVPEFLAMPEPEGERLELIGGKSVWAVYPEERVVHVFDRARGSKIFADSEPLTDPVLPGFSIPTSAIFEGV